jgi:anti-sigma regulatory factor (Ser/Thr protein kinase)
MRSRRRGSLLAVAIVLAVVAAAAILIMFAIVGPVIVVVALATVALLAGVASRLSPSSPRQAGEGPRPFLPDDALNPGEVTGAAATDPPWVMLWESVPQASAVPFARDQVTRVLAEWGLPGEAGEPTQLVVTELISNAIDHARAPIQLTVSFSGDTVRVEVRDATVEPPRQQPPDPWRVRGRGLQMVDALSSQWGWTADDAGKTVWADVSIGWPPD